MKNKRFIPKVVSSMLAFSMCAGQLAIPAFAAGSAREAAANVILNRPAIVTGASVNTRPDMTLEKVNDGKKDTRVSLVDQSEEDIQFEFTLEGAKRIDRVEIYERCDRSYGDAPRIDEVTVQVQTGIKWETVKNAVKTSSNEGNNTEHITVTFDPIVAKGKVRVITTDHEKANPTIWEMEVYGVDAEAPESKKVTYSLKNMSVNGPATVEIGKDLSFTLTADYGYALPETISIAVDGEILTEGYTYEKKTGKVTVLAVSGDVTVTAKAVEGETAATGLVRLEKGQIKKIDTRFADTEEAVVWTSNHEEVAVVDAEGKVTAKSEGTAVITAAAGDKTEYCTVVVDGYMRTWYDEPAVSWERDCLPIGNGNLGGMIYGNTEKEQIQVNEITLWSKGNGYQGGNKEGAWKNLKTIQDQMFSRLDSDFSGINVGGILGNQNGCGAYQTLGDIYFDFEGAARTAAPKNYMRELDLDDGLVRVSYENDGVNFTREYMADYPDNVMAFRLTSSKEDALEFKLDYNPGGGRTTIIDKAEENSIIYQGKVNAGGMAFATEVKVVAPDADVTCNNDGTISVANGEDVLVLMSAGTNYDITENKNIKNISDFYTEDGDYLDNEDPNGDVAASKVSDRVDAATEKGYAELVKTHLKDYQEIMGRVGLDLGDKEKAELTTDALLDAYKEERSNYAETVLFQMGRYLLLSSSRDSLPANLQGIWNDSNSPGWNSDYHFNVNLQMNYWPAFVTDMQETAMPLVDYMDSLRAPGNVTAREHFGVQNGWVVNTEANPFGKTAPGNSFSWGFTPGSGVWTCQNLWDYYEFTKDPAVLEKIYPILKEGTRFWLGYMVEDPRTRVDGVEGTGELVAAPGGSSEHGQIGVGTTYDMSLAYMVMKNTAEAAKILGQDDELQQQIEAALPRMKPFWIGTDGQLKEWREETGYSSMPGTEKLHRHLSHLLALHPGNLITKEGGDFSEYYDAAVQALKFRDDGSSAVGWSMAQKGNIFARVRDGEKALHHMNLLLTKGLGDNLLDVYVHPGWGDIFQIEANMGYTAGVAEMLLQSHQGFIEPLPALPETWADGSYTGLVARGNFKTDAVWTDSKLEKFVVRSENGGECIIRYPNISKSALNGGTFTVIDTDTVKIDTVKGSKYVFADIPARKAVKEIHLTSKSGVTLLEKAGQTIQMNAEVLPADADNREVIWKVTDENGGEAASVAINENGLLTATDKLAVQNIKVTAIAKDGSDISGEMVIRVVTEREDQEKNVVLNRPVTMTGADIYDRDDLKLSHINDGKLGTRMAIAGGGQHTSAIQFDFELEGAKLIDRIELYEYLDRAWGANGRIDKVEVQIPSGDGWETVAEMDTPDDGTGDGKRKISLTFEPVTAENVRIQVTDNDKKEPTIWEVEVYGKEDSMPFVNKDALIDKLEETAALTEADFADEAGWAGYQEAREEALKVVNNPKATQKEVDDVLTWLVDSLKESEVEEADKEYLAELIKYAEKQQENEDYPYVVPVVKKAFEKALADAAAVNVKAGATQAEVDAAYDKLLDLTHYLGFTGNSDVLKVTVDAASKLVENVYTEESWALFAKALAEAKAVLANENSLQAEIDVANEVLNKAMDALVKYSVNKAKLEELIKDSQKYEDTLDQYTEITGELFDAAFKNAQEVFADKNATQEEVNNAYAVLQNAIFGLRLFPNKDKLEGLIKDAEAVDTANYTVKSATAFAAALDNAKAVFADENATEKDVKAAEEALEEAQKNLVAKADADKEVDKETSSKEDNKAAGNNGSKKEASKSAAKTGDAGTALPAAVAGFAVLAALLALKKKR